MLMASRHILDILDTIETDPRRKGYVAALRESDDDLKKLIDRILVRDDKRSEAHTEVTA
jgi:hypothetical protein